MKHSAKRSEWAYETSFNAVANREEVLMVHETKIYAVGAWRDARGQWVGELLTRQSRKLEGGKSWEPARNQPDVATVEEIIVEAERRVKIIAQKGGGSMMKDRDVVFELKRAIATVLAGGTIGGEGFADILKEVLDGQIPSEERAAYDDFRVAVHDATVHMSHKGYNAPEVTAIRDALHALDYDLRRLQTRRRSPDNPPLLNVKRVRNMARDNAIVSHAISLQTMTGITDAETMAAIALAALEQLSLVEANLTKALMERP